MDGFNESDLGVAIAGLITNWLSREVHTAMPGRVEKAYVNQGIRIVEVLPLIRNATLDGQQHEMTNPFRALLLTVGTSRSSILMPVQAGDLVLLIFSERALEHWKKDTSIVNGVYGRHFDLSDAFAIPFNFKGLDTGYNNEDMIVEHEDQKLTIKKNGDIEIGGTDLKKLINDEFADLFNNHTHNYVGFVGTGTPTSYVTSSPAKLAGMLPVHINATPPVPPQVNLFADDLTESQMTLKVAAQ